MNSLDVEANYVDYTHIKFECPICRTKYKKNGEPYAKSKPIVHIHGSCGNISNRVEHRIAHCGWERNRKSFNIHITKNTFRPSNIFHITKDEFNK